jgi:hypothetical protein
VAEDVAEPPRRRFEREALIAAAAAAAFIALSVWWLLYDRRTPGGGDPADHLRTTLDIADLLRDLDLGGIAEIGFNADTNRFYPPLVPLVGSPAPLLGLTVQDWGTIALNLVFVPMLAAGTYLAGRRVFGPLAGALAAVFALGTPIVLSLFHVFLLDAPLAGSVALAFAALLASERFADRRASIAAGALLGVALLVKTIAPVYLLGPIAVMLAGGGWRQWRNVGLFCLAVLVVAGPYYAIHFEDVFGVSKETTIGGDVGATGSAFERDPRLSLDNLGYYGWAAINEQYFVPLLALFAVGFVATCRAIRSRTGAAELLAGIVVTYLALTLVLAIRDPRYTLPLVVFVAVIATGWIATAAGWPRRIGLAVLALAVTVNVATSMVKWVPDVRIEPPGTNYEFGIDPGSFTIVEDRGYWVGPPEHNPLWQRLFEAAEREDLETMRLFIGQQPLFWGVDWKALDIFGEDYGVREVTVNTAPPYDEPDILVSIWTDDSRFVGELGLSEPCGRIEEGAGLLDGEPVLTSVLVERRTPDGYERWCDF